MINQPKKPPDLCNYGVITCRKSSWIMDDNIMIQFKVNLWYVMELCISWSEKISVVYRNSLSWKKSSLLLN